MDLVIDANILFSALIKPYNITSEILFSNEFNLFAPDYILTEFFEHKSEILSKTNFNEQEFDLILTLISSRITFIPFIEFMHFIKKAEDISPDKDDVEYFALAIKLNCTIWSNDKELKKQKIVKIYSTDEVINFQKGK